MATGRNESSVRIELVDAEGVADHEVDIAEPERRTRTVPLLLGALTLVGLIFVTLRPDPGENAAGEALAAPTTTSIASTTTTDEPARSTTPESTTTERPTERADLNGVPFPPYPASIVEVTDGWLSVAFTDAPALWRSADGQSWERAADAPEGHPIGLVATDDGVLLVVEEHGSWLRQQALFERGAEAVPYSLTFWTSPDGRTWSQDADHPARDGFGLPIHAIGRDGAIVVSAFVDQEPDFGPGIEFLSQFVDASALVGVCDTRVEIDRIVVFDCAGNELIDLREDTVEADLEWNQITACARRFFEFSGPSIELTHFRPGAEPASSIVSTGSPFEFVPTADGWLTVASDRFGAGLPDFCDGVPGRSDDTTEGTTFVRWSRGGGTETVATIEATSATAFLSNFVPRPDGTLLYLTPRGVWSAAEPFVSWGRLYDAPPVGHERGQFGFTPLTASLDGGFLLYQTGAVEYVRSIDDGASGTWSEIDLAAGFSPSLAVIGGDGRIVVRVETDEPQMVVIELDP